MVSLSVCVLFLGLKVFSQFAEASYTFGNNTSNSSTSIKETCLTKYGHSSVTLLSSSTRTNTISSTIFTTLQTTPTVTFTPAPSTFTSISTVFSSITLTQLISTDTFTSTAVSTETETATTTLLSTAISTATVTATVQQSTVVAATPGFTALGSIYSVSKKRKRFEKPNSEDDFEEDCTCEDEAPRPIETGLPGPLKFKCDDGGNPWFNRQLHATAVDCEKTVQIISTSTVTISSNTTQTQTAQASSVYTTQTLVETVTVTVAPPDASTTITISSTQTTVSTQTAFSTTISIMTSTSTTVLPLATSYAVCEPDNIVSFVDGKAIVEVELTNGLLASSAATSATTCCNQCATAAGCGGFAYFPGSCYLLNDSNQGTVCNGAASSWAFQTDSGASSITVGNGNCGQGVFSGSY